MPECHVLLGRKLLAELDHRRDARHQHTLELLLGLILGRRVEGEVVDVSMWEVVVLCGVECVAVVWCRVLCVA